MFIKGIRANRWGIAKLWSARRRTSLWPPSWPALQFNWPSVRSRCCERYVNIEEQCTWSESIKSRRIINWSPRANYHSGYFCGRWTSSFYKRLGDCWWWHHLFHRLVHLLPPRFHARSMPTCIESYPQLTLMYYDDYQFLEAGFRGRLMAYYPSNGTAKVLLRDLCFPNGMTWHEDKKSILFSELNNYRIVR